MINALAAPIEAACQELEEAEHAAAAVPARIPLGDLAPDIVRLDAEIKQITHAIRMAAYNAETALARGLDGDYSRAGDEAYALIREALTGDIQPGNGELPSGSTRSPRPGAPRPSPPCATSSPPPAPAIPAPISSCATRSNPIAGTTNSVPTGRTDPYHIPLLKSGRKRPDTARTTNLVRKPY